MFHFVTANARGRTSSTVSFCHGEGRNLRVSPAKPAAVTRLSLPPLPQLLGTWLYVAGAAQYPQHRVEMLFIDHAYLRLDPGASGQELLISHYVAV